MRKDKVTPTTPAEADELDLLLAEDDDGNIANDDDVIADAMKVELIRFRAGNRTHKIELKKILIPARLMSRVQSIQSKLAMQAGYTAGEQIGDEEDDAADASRASQFLLLIQESEEIDEAWADIAVAATVKVAGAYRTSVPQFRTGLSRDTLLNDGIFGMPYIKAVRDFLADGSTGSVAATGTTNEANSPEPSQSGETTSTEPADSPPTSGSTS